MPNPIKKAAWSFLNLINLGGAVQILLKSYLRDNGWLLSFKTKRSTDRNNKPIPWVTYPFLEFFAPRLKKQFDVFEFGSGNSTIWFSERVNSISSVEHDENWYEMMKKKELNNVSLFLSTSNEDYATKIKQTERSFDIVFIDGIVRNECTFQSVGNLKEGGIIVIDNSDRINLYSDAYGFLKSNGFKRIDFWGMHPIVADHSCTTIFYKSSNCLGI